jgi:adenylate cyclase, class 2
MKYEVESKYRIEDAAALRRRLAALGGDLGDPNVQVDRYFNHPARDFARTDEALRIRSSGKENRITYKGPRIDAATKTRRELELPIAPGAEAVASFVELLLALGFVPVADVRKSRRLVRIAWRGANVEVAWDQVDAVGEFLELELSADETTLADAQRVLADLAAELRPGAPERRSYLELLISETAPHRNCPPHRPSG